MPIHYPDILSEASERRSFSYTTKDAILYALSIGMGEDAGGLPFVYEPGLQLVPTAVTVLGGSIMPPLAAGPGLRKSSFDFPKVVHGEQEILIYRPLRPADTLFTSTRTISVEDKGEGRGAVVVTETRWTDEGGADVAALVNTIFARGDGGFGGPRAERVQQADEPARAPDISVSMPTRRDQALLYRLNGDGNPLHADPAVAMRVGFPGPIMHGLCTFGMTCRAILQHVVGGDSSRIFSHRARFTAPLFPGETLRVDLWVDGDSVDFRAVAVERDVAVIRNGCTALRPAAARSEPVAVPAGAAAPGLS
ncbi:MaoC family dehydratase [Sphingopyxis sp. Root1497]|uniref:MaoC family dehydratase n=1 Tax=Sphingopyxis sp. Root1497 TaxID=1736474 RepID=UPI0009EBBD10|nr:MaoC family dehydratase [Sphingopyxis sp. Root1497]